MFSKYAILFSIVCIITTITTFLGSVIGHAIGGQALLAGAILAGISGVYVSCLVAHKLNKLPQKNLRSTFIGGMIGFIAAAIIAVNFLHYPFVVLVSITLIGAGAVLGYYIADNKTT
jgi:hypothetical protein